MDTVYNIPIFTYIFWCPKVYNGRYLLYHQKFYPDADNIILIREVYIYAELVQQNFLKNGFILLKKKVFTSEQNIFKNFQN